MKRPTFFQSFTRAQASSVIATLADFTTLVALVEMLGLWYVTATAIGALVGAVVNFMLGRHWSFVALQGRIEHQIFKYSIISGLSLLLNTLGVYVFTDLVGLKYTLSKLIVAGLVGIFFNFPLHRSFVFRH